MTDVLIVDDEEDICQYLRDTLEQVGLSCRFVLTGEEALKVIGEETFKMYVVDMKLSTIITGLQVIEQIRARVPLAIIVAMTGYVDQVLKQEAERNEINAYLEKPADLDIDVFPEKIKSLLSEQRLREGPSNSDCV